MIRVEREEEKDGIYGMKRPEGEFFYALFSKRENITHLKKNEKKTIYDVAD